MEETRPKFVEIALYAMGTICLMFIFFTAIFSGSWHSLGAGGIYLEYLILAGAIVFCAGLLGLMVFGFWYPIAVISLSSIITLAGFLLYWREGEALLGMVLVLVLLVIQILVSRYILFEEKR